MRHPSPAASSGEAFATFRTPPRHHPTPAGAGHAFAEILPALAHRLARLLGPFHVESPFCVKPLGLGLGPLSWASEALSLGPLSWASRGGKSVAGNPLPRLAIAFAGAPAQASP